MIAPIHIPQKKKNGRAKGNNSLPPKVAPAYPLGAFFGRLDALLDKLLVEEIQRGQVLTIINGKADPHHDKKKVKP